MNDENSTLWNSSLANAEVIPESFDLPKPENIDVFSGQDAATVEVESQPYQTKFDESNLAYVVA